MSENSAVDAGDENNAVSPGFFTSSRKTCLVKTAFITSAIIVVGLFRFSEVPVLPSTHPILKALLPDRKVHLSRKECKKLCFQGLKDSYEVFVNDSVERGPHNCCWLSVSDLKSSSENAHSDIVIDKDGTQILVNLDSSWILPSDTHDLKLWPDLPELDENESHNPLAIKRPKKIDTGPPNDGGVPAVVGLVRTSGEVDKIVQDVLTWFSKGTVPVLLLDADPRQMSIDLRWLPYSDVIDWSKAVLTYKTETEAVAELPYLDNSRIFFLRRQGLKIWEAYFSTLKRQTDFLLAVLRHRMGFDPLVHQDAKSQVLMTKGKVPMSLQRPLMHRQWSLPSLTSEESYFLWNVAFFPWKRPPTSFPVTFNLPEGFSQQKGGSKGVEQSLLIKDKFTVVTGLHRRNDSLPAVIRMFAGMKELHLILILWNSTANEVPQSLTSLLDDLKVPVMIIRTKQESINARMIPYDIIETECIFQADNDTRHLNKNLITAGFATWLEHKSQLVGYMGRNINATLNESKWTHHTDKRNKRSMIIAATLFHHKYYSYRYSYEEPAAWLRNPVECIDIFLDAVVYDLTLHSSAMVWEWIDLDCHTCDISTNNSASAFKKRNTCINKVSKKLDYLPGVPKKTTYSSLSE